MPNFRINKTVYPVLALVFIGLWTIILSNVLGEKPLNAALFAFSFMIVGLYIEFDHRKAANKKISKNLYRAFSPNSVYDPSAVDRSLKLQFIRLWHFAQMWPLHLYRIVKIEMKNTNDKKGQ